MKLLLIKDENHLAKDISHYLNSKDVRCEWANNFEIALEKINAYDYDCVLLDLMLPDGNGMNILKAIKNSKKTKVCNSKKLSYKNKGRRKTTKVLS